MSRRLLLAVLVVGALARPAPAQIRWPTWLAPRDKPAGGRLPGDLHPSAYALDLYIDPDLDRFQGTVRIRTTFDRARDVAWLHASGLDIRAVRVEGPHGASVGVRATTDAATGLLGMHFDRRVGPGEATLILEWTAPWATQGPGLHRYGTAPHAYVVAQLGAGAARRMLPCFDEPRFVTPWDVRVIAPRGLVVAGNARVFASAPQGDDRVDVQLARTAPLPTHLLALAVGPFDVVEGPPLRSRLDRTRRSPLRGLGFPGQRQANTRALADIAALVPALEQVIGTPPPFDKLDAFAGFGLFAIPTLGVVPTGPVPASTIVREDALSRRHALARAMAHGWIDPAIVLGWWSERWLPDALSAWAGARAVGLAYPDRDGELSTIELARVVMDRDGLATALAPHHALARVREARATTGLLESLRGIAWLGHVEHWVGTGRFRNGLRAFLTSPRLAASGPDGFLDALAHAAQRDVATPMRTFLDQPGVPLLDVRLSCIDTHATAELRQSRWLPVGSWADARRTWQIPVCLRTGRRGSPPRERCILVTEPTMTVPLGDDGCPDWILPNADGAGYYRWALPTADFGRLLAFGWPSLAAPERLIVTDALIAAFAAGTLPASDLFVTFDVITTDTPRAIVAAPMATIRFTREHLLEPRLRTRVDGWGRDLYARWWERLGWSARRGEAPDRTALRPLVIDFLARIVRDPAVRQAAAARGRRILAAPGGTTDLAPEVAEIALTVVAEQGDPRAIATMLARITAGRDPGERARLLRAVGAVREPTLVDRVRTLALDPALRDDERLLPLASQLRDGSTREGAWTWLVGHLDALIALLPESEIARLPWLTAEFCDDVRAADVRTWLGPAVERTAGGTAQLDLAVETIHLCAARVAAQRASANSYFAM